MLGLRILLSRWGKTLSAHPAWGIQVDRKGNIYFPDIIHNGRGSLWIFTVEGELLLIQGDFHAHNVSLDSLDNPVAAHGELNHTLIRFRRGFHDTLFHSMEEEEFFGGNCTFYRDQTIYFGIRKHIWRYTLRDIGHVSEKDSSPTVSWTEKYKWGNLEKVTDQELLWNQCIYVDKEGFIYAPDIGQGFGSLFRISPDGETVLLADSLISVLDRPRDKHDDVLLGICKGPDGAVYIGDKAGQRIIRIETGEHTESEESPGSAMGKQSDYYRSKGNWFPCGITFHEGTAYILENQPGPRPGPQIVTFHPDFGRTTIFNYDDYQEKHPPQEALDEQEGYDGWKLFGRGGIALLIASLLWKLIKNWYQDRLERIQSDQEYDEF